MPRALQEIIKFVYGLLLSGMLVLFFCLLLDVFCYVVGGGWNPLLGSWPIFSGSVGAVVYGSTGTVVCLMLGVGAVARMILWDRVPVLLDFLSQPNE